MDAIGFVHNYHDYLDEIRLLIKPEYLPILDEISKMDPHDLISPDSYFFNEDHVKGVLCGMILSRTKKMTSVTDGKNQNKKNNQAKD